MKKWKISNISKQPVKFAFKFGLGSKGIILNANEICVVEPQNTSFIEAQERRRFISVDREFDNSKLNLEIGKSYTTEQIDFLEQKITKSKLEKAKENVEKYMNKS